MTAQSNLTRWLSYLVLIVILLFGFFKYWICHSLSPAVAQFLQRLGVDSQQLLVRINELSHDDKFRDHYLGWFVYYPAYLGLHLLFIWLLFYRNSLWRKRIMLGLIILVISLLVCIAVGRVLHIGLLYIISFTLFQNLFSLPFILLMIEGGRILWQDVNKL